MASADALDEEWWLPPEERERERALAKRKGSNDTDVTKKKKRKTISRELSTKKEESFSVLHSAVYQRNAMEEFMTTNMAKASIEAEMNIKFKTKYFINYNDETNIPGDIQQYINAVCPKLDQWIDKSSDSKGSPCVIIICSSALRALELRQQLLKSNKINSVAKLFAKHIKIEDQKKILTESLVSVAVATPERLLRLLNDGAVNMSHMKRIIFDWSWRNAKLKKLADIPEVSKAVCDLYREYFNELILNHKVKLILY